MSLIGTVRKIAGMLMDLAMELESRGLHQSSYALNMAINRVRWLERICIYTKGMMARLEKLNEKIGEMAEKMLREDIKDLKEIDEYLTGLAMDLDHAVRHAIYKYAKARLSLAILMALYSTTSMLSISISMVSELAMGTVHVIIWLSILLYTLMLLDLTAMFIPVIAIPMASVIAFLYAGSDFVMSNLSLALAHVMCLSVAVSFVAINISYYRLLHRGLILLRDKIGDLVNSLRRVLRKPASEIQIYPVDLHKLMVDLYGDKAYELIKYVNDMRSLAK